MAELVPYEKSYYAMDRHEMLDFVPKTCTEILEIGCGNGAFGRLVKARQSCRYLGIELVPAIAREAQTYLDEVKVGAVDQIMEGLPQKAFDCIICNDVLEHLVDPDKVVRQLKLLLKPKGVLVFSLPNVRYIKNLVHLLVQKDWHYDADGGILDITHLRFFTAKSMRRFFVENGFEVDVLQGVNPTRFYRLLKCFNFLTLGLLSDTAYMQFAGIATPTSS